MRKPQPNKISKPVNPRIASSVSRKRVTVATRPRSHRTFDPHRYGGNAIDDNYSGLRRLETNPGSIVLAVQGSCSNGTGTRAAYGVFISNLIPSLNQSGLLPVQIPQTSQCAELHAAKVALDSALDFVIAGEEFSHVIVKTDSDYLARNLCESIWKWIGNGYINSEGLPVANGRFFKVLHEKITLLENEYGMNVSFCLVPKGQNMTADYLAKEALLDGRYPVPAEHLARDSLRKLQQVPRSISREFPSNVLRGPRELFTPTRAPSRATNRYEGSRAPSRAANRQEQSRAPSRATNRREERSAYNKERAPAGDDIWSRIGSQKENVPATTETWARSPSPAPVDDYWPADASTARNTYVW